MAIAVLEDRDLQILNSMIMEIPAKWANPMIDFLNRKIEEQKQKEEAAKKLPNQPLS